MPDPLAFPDPAAAGLPQWLRDQPTKRRVAIEAVIRTGTQAAAAATMGVKRATVAVYLKQSADSLPDAYRLDHAPQAACIRAYAALMGASTAAPKQWVHAPRRGSNT